MNKDDVIRREVSEFYTRAVSRPGSGCCGGETVRKGAVVETAGYSDEDLATLPEDAIDNAFGCGNPVAYAEVRPGDVVLDLGSGAGIDLLLAARRVGAQGRVIGVDMTDDMIAKARSNIAEAGFDNIEVRKGVIEDMPVDDASVDWVFSNCVINLSPEKHRVFAEIARVLKPGGRMLVSDIVVEELPGWIRESKEFHGACLAGAITEEAYLEGLREAGLTEVEVVNRLVYEASQLEGLLAAEMPDAAGCCFPGGRDLGDVTRSVEGNVWSAKFKATKAG